MMFAASVMAGAASAQVPAPTDTVILTSAAPYSVTGDLFILKADTNTVALHNPVLVVEGFDIGNSINWPELYDLLNQENLLNDLQAFGRDLLVLNFTDSTADIIANTALNETAIDYINANRADPSDKFTTVGASLGGLTLRKALVDKPDHDVDAWISFDAPHEGANIPLGIQEYLEFFAGYNASASNLLVALDRPAARQLLLVHHTHPDGLTGGSLPERADFEAVMAATGYPTNCKTIAISNGSGFGEKLPFSPGEQIIRWTYPGGFLDPDIEADVYALPQSPATVFEASITLLLPIDSANVNAYHPLPFDNAPGGTRATFFELYTNIPPEQISSDDYCNQTNHCFVPTVSALGIPIENIESNLAANASLTALSPFDEIYYAVGNEDHVEINASNKRWIMRAVLENRDSDGDGLDDYGEYLIGTDYSSPESLLEIVQHITATNGNVEVEWNAYPNTQFSVWFTDALTNAWSLVETIPPTTQTNLIREYAAEPKGFFVVSGEIADPADE
jgi:pimeloyl-ACP methyl ester carboxylesterase